MPPRSRSASAKRRATRIENEEKASALALDPTGASTGAPYKFTPDKDQWDGTWEFGGWPGALAIMVISHFLVYYAFCVIKVWGGEMVYPGHSKLNGVPFLTAFKDALLEHCRPTVAGFTTYLTYLFVTWLLAVIMPGPVVVGKKVPSENGFQHRYKCNAVYAWYAMLVAVFALWKTGVWSLTDVARNYGTYLTAAVIVADIASVIVFVWGLAAGRAVRMTGNWLYDFFMGSCLNPKLPLGVDFKMVAELRISWAYLFFITLSHAMLQYEKEGFVTSGMYLLLLGHFLYANACQKGEECVPSCWDIYYEKFGWMLIFWNLAGVPVFYGVQALFIYEVRRGYQLPAYIWAPLTVVLFIAYYIFDTAASQKNRFRMMRDGVPMEILQRKTFPQLPWGFIPEPKTLKGTGKLKDKELFVDGWFKYARKINYTADSVMAFIWGAACGFGYFIPFLYWTFHFFMLLHRVTRDEHLMSNKYGKMWEEYIAIVPYRFIPGVF